MKDIYAARYYARSFYPVLEKQLDSAGRVFSGMAQVLKTSPDMNKFLAHPLFSITEKKNVLFKTLKTEISPEIEECLVILIGKRKTALVPDILEEVNNLRREKQGIQHVFIKTAWELSEKEKDILEGKLSGFTGKKIDASYTLNKELIAGLTIKIGDEIIDNSLIARINNLKEQFLSANAIVENTAEI